MGVGGGGTKACFSGSCWELVDGRWREAHGMMEGGGGRGRKGSFVHFALCPSVQERHGQFLGSHRHLGSSRDLQERPYLGRSGQENQRVSWR